MAFTFYTAHKLFIPKGNDNEQSDQPATVELHPLSQGDLWKLTAWSERFDKLFNNSDSKDAQAIVEAMVEIKPYLEQYATHLINVNVDDKPISPPELADYPAFLPLVTEIVQELIARTVITEEQKKKSEKQS